MLKEASYEILDEWRVEVVCPLCGHTHWVASRLPLEDGPSEPMTVAQCFEGREWPDQVKDTLSGSLRCPTTRERFTVDDTGGTRTVLISSEWATKHPWPWPEWKLEGGGVSWPRRRRRVRVYGHDGDQNLVWGPWWVVTPLEAMTRLLPEDLALQVFVESWICEDGLQGEMIVVELDEEENH